jgi:hypothetical protein
MRTTFGDLLFAEDKGTDQAIFAVNTAAPNIQNIGQAVGQNVGPSGNPLIVNQPNPMQPMNQNNMLLLVAGALALFFIFK